MYIYIFVITFSVRCCLFWKPCYYPRKSRYSFSPVCGIFRLCEFSEGDGYGDDEAESMVMKSLHPYLNADPDPFKQIGSY